MGEDDIKLGAGTLYFKGPEGWDPLGEVGEVVEDPVDPNDIEYQSISLANALGEITMALQLTAEAGRQMMVAFLGVSNAMMGLCPNKRVVHLARHAKKWRTRKKNRRRAFKILEKEAKQ